MPPLYNAEENDSDGSADDESWQEVDDDGNNENSSTATTRCLFCTDTFKSVELAIDHLSGHAHHLDLTILKARFNMDQYSFIKVHNKPYHKF